MGYSIETGTFDRLASLDVMMTLINQLIAARQDNHALQLLRKTVEARNRILGELDTKALAAAHLLPRLLNRVKRYEEALECGYEVLGRE